MGLIFLLLLLCSENIPNNKESWVWQNFVQKMTVCLSAVCVFIPDGVVEGLGRCGGASDGGGRETPVQRCNGRTTVSLLWINEKSKQNKNRGSVMACNSVLRHYETPFFLVHTLSLLAWRPVSLLRRPSRPSEGLGRRVLVSPLYPRLSCARTWFFSRCSVAPGHSWSGDLGAAGLFLAAATATIRSRLLWIARFKKLFPLWLFLTRSEHLRCFQVSLATWAASLSSCVVTL